MQVIFKARCLQAGFLLVLSDISAKESANNVTPGPAYALSLIFKLQEIMTIQSTKQPKKKHA